jgi:hypothetical protein
VATGAHVKKASSKRTPEPPRQRKPAHATATKAAKAAPEARDGAKAPDAREAARLAAWEAPPAAASDGGEVFGDEDSMRTGGVPSPHWCSEATDYNDAVGELLPLVNRFARLAQSEGDQSCLVAARIIHALATYLGLPRERRNEKSRRPFLNKAAAILGSQAGIPEDRFPRLLTIHKQAEEALESVVKIALADGRDAAGIASAVEIVRKPLAPLGMERILPQKGSEADRIKRSTDAIKKLQLNADGGRLRDAKAIVNAIARAAGYAGGKLFEADRKRNKRS